MKYTLKRGDFLHLGTRVQGATAIITFEVTTSDPAAILFYEMSGDALCFHLVEEIPMTDEFRIGRIFSVAISGIDFAKYAYLLRRNGTVECDPCASLIFGREIWCDKERVNDGYAVYGGFVTHEYEWQNGFETPVSPEDMVMYKLHIRGFTMGQNFRDAYKGNYRGLLQKLNDLKNLGVTTLECMPLYDFEEWMYRMKSEMVPGKRMRLVPDEPYSVNYWGYGKANYFAPKASYFGGKSADVHAKEMIDAIHGHGMEIVLLFSFDPACSDNFIVECLKYWVREYHIDGVHLVGSGLPIERIARDPYLGRTKIFYDQFPAELLEQEKKYGYKHLFRYDSGFLYPLRKLQNHKDGSIIEFANGMKRQAGAFGYVNFAANNNGFTLYDAYSYSEKHNEKNGEGNRDGENFNFSHNYGWEGETKNKQILSVRSQHVRLALAATLLSQGIPLILSGDELFNSQEGNNNAYCQDNEIGWVNFSRKKSSQNLKAYVKNLITFRQTHTVLSAENPVEMTDYHHYGVPDLSYHGREPWTMWLSDDKKSIGMMYYHLYARTLQRAKKDTPPEVLEQMEAAEEDVYLCFNFYFDDETFALPKLPGRRKWFYVTNTAEDVWEPSEEPLSVQHEITVPGQTLTILVGRSVARKKRRR